MADYESVMTTMRERLRARSPRVLEIAEVLCGNVDFTQRKVQVGFQKTGEKFVGVHTKEVPHPADDIDIRPMRDMSEMDRLLPTEHVLDSDQQWMRMVSGEALVTAHVETTMLMEDVHSPQYKMVMQVLYVLWDVSPSMFNDEGRWRVPYWQAVLLTLLRKAMRENVLFLCRPFGNGAAKQIRVATPAQAIAFMRMVMENPPMIGGTDIGDALNWSIKDYDEVEYDRGDVVLVSDGEHNGDMDPTTVRQAMSASNLRLHAIMLGVNNDLLRQACDVFQIVDQDGHPHPVERPHG